MGPMAHRNPEEGTGVVEEEHGRNGAKPDAGREKRLADFESEPSRGAAEPQERGGSPGEESNLMRVHRLI